MPSPITRTIGGITYQFPPSVVVPNTSTDLDGFCCEECLDCYYLALKEGRATILPDASTFIKARFEILKNLHHLRTPLPPTEARRFLLTGIFAVGNSGERVRESEYNRYGVTGAEYQIRLAYAYLLDHVFSGRHESDSAHSLLGQSGLITSALRTVPEMLAWEATLRLPFRCQCCDNQIDDLDGALCLRLPSGSISTDRPNTCRACLEDSYRYSTAEDRWLPEAEEYAYVEGVGPISIPFAEANYYRNSDGEWLREAPSRTRLLNYSEDPFSHFEWDSRNKPNALVFGVELEMQSLTQSAAGRDALVEALGGSTGQNFILKSDGSIGYGAELVTMPFTLAQHLDNSGVPWKDTLAKVQGIARSAVGTDSCGIHIHINKKALSALTIGKMLVFLNAPNLATLVTMIAQRPSTQYCGRSAKKLTDGTRSSSNRYDIMNVSVRHPTCEIRMFKGNITLERVYKNIEFCHALVQYCRQSSMRTLTDWGAFSAWLIAHRGQYQNLVRFLVDKKCIGFRQLTRDSRDGQVTIEDR